MATSSSSSSCSHWWHAPFYIAMSITLVIIFFSTAVPSHRHHPLPNQSLPSSPSLTSQTHIKISLNNATQSLRLNGFNFIATLLHLSPHIFLSTPQSTIFAIKDSTLSNLSLPPLFLQELLKFHTLPTKYSMKELLKKPVNTCLPTNIVLKNLAVTKKGEGGIEINNVLITHPDLFLDGPFSIHGVDKAFTPLISVDKESKESTSNLDIVQLPVCDLKKNHSGVLSLNNYEEIKKRNEWRRIVQVLSVNGFVPFAIGLNTVFNEILDEYGDLNSVTIFAPPTMAILALPPVLLDKFVKFHVVPQSLSFKELASMPEDHTLRTLVPDKELVITTSIGFSRVLAINGVEVTAPDMFVSKKFTIHGVARAFSMEELTGLFLE